MNTARKEPSLSFSFFLFVSVAVLSATVLTWKRKGDQTRWKKDADTDSPTRPRRDSVVNTKTLNKAHLPLPSHLERELYKETRRKKMIPILAMKKPMYDNILMKDPSGHTLCTVGLKKANWYVRKDLAYWEEDDAIIRLKFEPKTKKNRRISLSKADEHSNKDGNDSFPPEQGQQQRQHLYNQTVKQNRCVICGADKDYRRHYIVPYCYRCRFPPRFKTHMPHDVVILCPDCHVAAQQISHEQMRDLEEDLRARTAVASAQPTWNDPVLAKLRSAACALLRWRNQLPDDKIHEYTQLVQDYYYVANTQAGTNVNHDGLLVLTEEHLKEASRVETQQPNPDYISGPDLVMNHLQDQIGSRRQATTSRNTAGDIDETDVELRVIGEFVREWRLLFYRTMCPRFLPEGWHVDAPVICDER